MTADERLEASAKLFDDVMLDEDGANDWPLQLPRFGSVASAKVDLGADMNSWHDQQLGLSIILHKKDDCLQIEVQSGNKLSLAAKVVFQSATGGGWILKTVKLTHAQDGGHMGGMMVTIAEVSDKLGQVMTFSGYLLVADEQMA
ncbi:MAG: hypothetical protein JWM56_462 [Candidatus Peribacteria bacterium]|nr:hypothetical protein [Candidatus Peribacteria bacterium]